MKITVLYYPGDICTMYTMYPLLRSKYRSLFDMTSNMEDVFKFKNKIIFVMRFFRRELSDQATQEYFSRLRDHYEKIIYFEDTPDPRKIMTNTIDYVDIYYKKSMLKDLSLYKKEYYSETLYGDYYHKKFGVRDSVETVSKPLTDAQIAKLKLAWNIGIGQYPKERIRRALCTRIGDAGNLDLMTLFLGHPKNYHAAKRRTSLVCPMRFRAEDEPKTLNYQRMLFSVIGKSRPDLFVFGKLNLDEYNRELRNSKLTFGSFGLGEICFRDFEAIINYSLLLKPDMDHLATWPDVYQKDITYVPLKWDGSDFIERIEYWQHADETEITKNAYECYMSSFEHYVERLEMVLDQVYSV